MTLCPSINLHPYTHLLLTVCPDGSPKHLSFLPQPLSKPQIYIGNGLTCGRPGIKQRMGNGTFQPIMFSSLVSILIQIHQISNDVNSLVFKISISVSQVAHTESTFRLWNSFPVKSGPKSPFSIHKKVHPFCPETPSLSLG